MSAILLRKLKEEGSFPNKILSPHQSWQGLPHLEPSTSWVLCSPLCSCLTCLHSALPNPHLSSPVLFIWLNPVQFSQSASAFRLNVPSFIPPLNRFPTILHPWSLVLSTMEFIPVSSTVNGDDISMQCIVLLWELTTVRIPKECSLYGTCTL